MWFVFRSGHGGFGGVMWCSTRGTGPVWDRYAIDMGSISVGIGLVCDRYGIKHDENGVGMGSIWGQ